MKARQLIADATFDPGQFKAIRKAFDDAWEQIAPQVSKRPDASSSHHGPAAQQLSATPAPVASTRRAGNPVRVSVRSPLSTQVRARWHSSQVQISC